MLVGEAKDERKALLLRLVRLEDLGEELGAEVGHRRADGNPGPDPAEGEELDREGGRLVREPEVGHPLGRGPVGRTRRGQAGDVALHVRDEDGHSRCG